MDNVPGPEVPEIPDAGGSTRTWSAYVQRVIKGSKQVVVAKRTGLDQATISRWLRNGRPGRVALVAQFARAYPEETTVLEAFVAAGYLYQHEVLRDSQPPLAEGRPSGCDPNETESGQPES